MKARGTPGRISRWLRRGVRGSLRRTLRRAAAALNYDIVERNIYSPIPHVPSRDSAIWERRSSLPGIAFDPAAHVAALEAELAPYVEEFRPPLDPAAGAPGFHQRNGYYGPLDAYVLYAMVRYHRPRRVLELGAGHSTLVMAQACAANAREGHPVALVAVDPQPRLPLEEALNGVGTLERRSSTELPIERFLELERGDILFADTSHVVKLGSEVNALVLEVLPRLRRGVLVHVHDIYLPYEYPRAWFARGTFCNEQYLLQAFLIENPSWQVLFAAHAVAREHRERVTRLVPSVALVDHAPSALWLRRGYAP